MTACSSGAVERGRASEVRVGSLDVVRDLLDVRDGVRAMWLIAQRASPGRIFDICSGTGYRLSDILRQLTALARTGIAVRRDPERVRPLAVPVIAGDNAKFRRLGWEPRIPIGRTLARILEYWRSVPE